MRHIASMLLRTPCPGLLANLLGRAGNALADADGVALCGCAYGKDHEQCENQGENTLNMGYLLVFALFLNASASRKRKAHIRPLGLENVFQTI